MMIIDNKFSIAQTVFLVTDSDQLPRIVTQLSVKPGNNIMYEISCGAACSWHYDFELTDIVQLEIKLK